MRKIIRAIKSTTAIFILLSSTFAMADETNNAAITCTETSGHHVFVEQRVCPIGGERFDAFVLGTHSTFGAYLDLTKVSYLTFPIAIAVCPSNGFVDYKEEYSDTELATLGATIETPEYKSLLGHHTSWHLFAELMDRSNFASNEDIELWWIRSRAAAESETCDTGQFEDYAKLALAQLVLELETTPPDDTAFWPMQLMAANYERRLGDQAGALKRMSELPEISAEWSLAFETLQQAIEEGRSDRVRIGEFQENGQND